MPPPSGELAAARIAFSGGAGKGLSLERHYAAADDGPAPTIRETKLRAVLDRNLRPQDRAAA